MKGIDKKGLGVLISIICVILVLVLPLILDGGTKGYVCCIIGFFLGLAAMAYAPEDI